MLRSWVVECRLRSWRGSASVEDCRGPLRWTSDVNSSYPLRVEAFHNSISPNGPCSGISCHHWKSEGTTVDHFQVGLGPGGAHQAFLFHWNTWTDIFFIDTNSLTFFTPWLVGWPDEHSGAMPETKWEHSLWYQRPQAGCWDGHVWSRACNILLSCTEEDLKGPLT